MSKVTEWYPASVKPARDGEYETRVGGDNRIIRRKFWRGKWWFFDRFAYHPGWVPSHFGASTFSQWRGLAEKPA